MTFPLNTGILGQIFGDITAAGADIAGSAVLGLTYIFDPGTTATESQDTITQARSLPVVGDPGSTVTLPKPDGSPKQVRRYGPDGKPETDVDHSPHHGSPNPHAHDWGRDANGKPTRGAPRPVTPDDPQPN